MEQARHVISRWTASITNSSIRNFLIGLFLAFVSGTFIASVPLYFRAQHEPKELFSMRELMNVSYAPLWIILAAFQFGPLIVTMVSTTFRPLRKYALAIMAGPFLMVAFPRLDPTYYSSFYTRCARLSEPEIIEFVRAGVVKEADVLVRLLRFSSGDTRADVERAELVQLVDWRPLENVSFSAKYRTTRAGMFELSIGPECAIDLYLVDQLVQPLGRVMYEKR
jgi:hypothetical protein